MVIQHSLYMILQGGPAGEFPAIIFEPTKVSEKSFVQKSTKKQADHRLTGAPISTITFPPSPPLPPLIEQYHSLNKGISIFLDATA
jgi:hypothetical protein